jgi:hypothetical protein
MFSKILITLGVIVVCMWMLAARGRPELREISNPADARRKKLFRNASIAFMAIMVVFAGTMLYLQVDEHNAVVTVHVVNTQSGETRTYQVRKKEIHSDGFTTLDGTRVFTAGVERIEIEAPD